MNIRIAGALTLTAALVGCQPAMTQVSTTGRMDAAVAVSNHIPVGTTLQVRLNETLGLDAPLGSEFTALVDRNVLGRDGSIVIPAGAMVVGTVTGVDEWNGLGDPAALRLDFHTIRLGGADYPLMVEVLGADIAAADDDDLEDLAEWAAMSMPEVALGAILPSNWQDPITSTTFGPGIGVGISLGFGEITTALPAGSRFTLRLDEAIHRL